ncbi:MAG: ABC transporter permease [Bacteroidales bacterium]|nr:ABC transporter permease [Bacteroidales bacterium]MBQ9722899.1 ABC transporter permease [Bacteroidales bacterium]
MKFRNIGTIISREYLTRVKKKSFLLTTFLVPIFFAAMCILPSVIMFMSEEKGKQVAVIDQSGIAMPYFVDSEAVDFSDYSTENVDSLKARFNDLGLDALVVISPVDEATRSVSVVSYSEKPMSIDMKESVTSKVNDAVEDYRLAQYQISDLKQIMEDIKSDVSMSTYTLSESGEEKITSSEVYMIISMVLSIIIYMFIAMFSGMVMQSVIEEKASRVVEVLVSSVKATELMFGKIIGVACVALTQFFLWILLTLLLVGGFSLFGGMDAMSGDPAQAEQMMQMAGMEASMGGMTAEDMMAMAQDESEMGAVLSTLKDINWGQMIFAFVIYFALGYLLYASFFAAIGSAVENEADTNQLQMPITVPLLLAFFIAIYAFNAPDSSVVWWGSMIPFTSPIVMLARIPFGVPAWELVLSIALLVATFVACGWASAKIYKIGILMFGKKTGFKDLWKWLKQK